MSKYSADLKDLLSMFEEHLSVADLTASRLLSGLSSTIVKNRIDMGKTQKEFAEYMGVSQSMVSKWESADYNFSVKALAEIASKLDLDITVRMYKSKIVEMSSESNIRSACILEPEKFRVIRNNQENEMPQKKKKIIYYMEKRDEMRVFVDHKEEKKWCNM